VRIFLNPRRILIGDKTKGEKNGTNKMQSVRQGDQPDSQKMSSLRELCLEPIKDRLSGFHIDRPCLFYYFRIVAKMIRHKK
jgi:hypothetical protein